MLARFVAVSLLTVVAFSTASGRVEAVGAPGPFMETNANSASLLPVRTERQNIYWTLFANADYPQVQIAKVPLTKKSKARTIRSTLQNNLLETSGAAFDAAGRFWILSYAQVNGNPTSALIFNLPVTAKSVPLYTLVLSGTLDADALAFDPSGDLWVASPGNQSVLEYTGRSRKAQH